MTTVSEKARYSNYSPIEIGYNVSITPKNNTKTDAINDTVNRYIAIDDDLFQDGTLMKKELLSEEGYGGNVQYTVQLKDGTEVTFSSSPIKYYFKVINEEDKTAEDFPLPPSRELGGKIYRKNKKTKKQKNKKKKNPKTLKYLFSCRNNKKINNQ